MFPSYLKRDQKYKAVDIILYDTATASFSIDQEDDTRKYGHSKKGLWAPQVVVALAVTTEGLPVEELGHFDQDQ